MQDLESPKPGGEPVDTQSVVERAIQAVQDSIVVLEEQPFDAQACRAVALSTIRYAIVSIDAASAMEDSELAQYMRRKPVENALDRIRACTSVALWRPDRGGFVPVSAVDEDAYPRFREAVKSLESSLTELAATRPRPSSHRALCTQSCLPSSKAERSAALRVLSDARAVLCIAE